MVQCVYIHNTLYKNYENKRRIINDSYSRMKSSEIHFYGGGH